MTKDTREAIARAITPVIARAEEKRARGETIGPATEAHIAEAYATADRVLTALEPAPAGGDVRELVEVLEKSNDHLRDILMAAPKAGEPDVTGDHYAIHPKLMGSGMDAVREIRRTLAALTATPAQPTPSGEVDGLVAEIDRHYKAARFSRLIAETDDGEYPARFYLSDGCTTCDATALCEFNTKYRPEEASDPRQASLAIAALVNAWPSLRTALGGGWRPIETAPKDGTEILACKAGRMACVIYWEKTQNDWGGRTYDDGMKRVMHPPTHWQPLPPPPRIEGET